MSDETMTAYTTGSRHKWSQMPSCVNDLYS